MRSALRGFSRQGRVALPLQTKPLSANDPEVVLSAFLHDWRERQWDVMAQHAPPRWRRLTPRPERTLEETLGQFTLVGFRIVNVRHDERHDGAGPSGPRDRPLYHQQFHVEQDRPAPTTAAATVILSFGMGVGERMLLRLVRETREGVLSEKGDWYVDPWSFRVDTRS